MGEKEIEHVPVAGITHARLLPEEHASRGIGGTFVHFSDPDLFDDGGGKGILEDKRI